MCGRYTLRGEAAQIAGHFGVDEFSEPPLKPRFNIAPTQSVPVVRLGLDGRRELVLLRWGLIPFWSKTGDTPYSTINARAESADEKPAFREPFLRRRCLVPADGFYEWQPAKPRKRPWFIHLKSGGLFGLAGLWDRWRGSAGEVVESVTVLVTDANELLKPIHERMPVLLKSEDYALWLNRDLCDLHTLKALLVPYPADQMEARPVGFRVNSAVNDDEDCLSP